MIEWKNVVAIYEIRKQLQPFSVSPSTDTAVRVGSELIFISKHYHPCAIMKLPKLLPKSCSAL